MDSAKSKIENERLEDASSEEIRSEIRGTRGRMDQTIDELGDRLHPRHLLDDVIALFQRPGSSAGTSAARSSRDAGRAVLRHVKENPVPALLVGAGLVWWMVDSSTDSDDAPTSGVSRYRDLPRDPVVPTRPVGGISPTLDGAGGDDATVGVSTGEGVEDDLDSGPGMLDRAKEKLAAGRESAADRGRSAKDGISDRWDETRAGVNRRRRAAGRKAGELRNEVSHRASDLQGRVADAGDEHPLAFGGILLAAGVCAGLLLPRSATEDAWMGEVADDLKSEAVTRTKDVASRTVGSALDEAEARDLTPGNLAEKAGRVVSQAVAAGKDAAREEGISGDQLAEDAKAVSTSAAETAVADAEHHAEEVNPENRPS